MNIEMFAIFMAVLALFGGIIFLIILAIIDFRKRLLPNIYVLGFAVCGVFFHFMTDFVLLRSASMVYGAILGGGFLYLVRFFGNRHYKRESLGMGDVKLMAAAGLWLGPLNTVHAITIGASLSVLHAVIYAVVKKCSLKELEIPFGPGLIAGIIIVLLWMVWDILPVWFDAIT